MDVIHEKFPHRVSEALSAAILEMQPDESVDTLINEHQDVFNEDKITPMTGEPMHIHLRRDMPGYKPLKVSTARRTPLHFKKQADELIKNLEASGVIVKVDANERVEWCSPGFFVPNPTEG